MGKIESIYNLEITFTYEDEPPYHRVMEVSKVGYRKPQIDDNITEVYDQNESLVVGFLQPILNEIPNKPDLLVLHDVEVKYEGEVVFKKDVYNVEYIPKKDRNDIFYG